MIVHVIAASHVKESKKVASEQSLKNEVFRETIPGFADRVAVMKDGAIQELGDTGTIISTPTSEYTKALLRAASY
ncbi:hypothetical protein P4H66_15475 [Paenibacillus dokdonensis]|uniref:Uncharacterized protein n=1 Tax=Paenibacillus dokdonensis TaxID=2567944 RepID=A0ABU6GSU9_9BACL|nr:hypothetical protein [Paenibacillus dokdonensis]MEC0241252.1 hypothetical protein [Paenibacillus dokdonensis]